MKKVLVASAMVSILAMVGCSKEAPSDAIKSAASDAQQHMDNAAEHADKAATSAQAEMVAAAKQAAMAAQSAAANTEAAAREAAASGAAAVENAAKDIKQDVKQ